MLVYNIVQSFCNEAEINIPKEKYKYPMKINKNMAIGILKENMIYILMENDENKRKKMADELEKKGVIIHQKEGRIFIYSAAISKDAYREAEGKSFLSRFFDGALNQMVVSFLDDDKLTSEDIDELKAILDKKRNQ